MKILVTGGSGYKGSILIPALLDLGHEIINYDTDWFGNYLPTHRNLKSIKNYRSAKNEVKQKSC